MNTPKYRINFKFLIGFVVVVGAILAGVHLLYRQQVGSQAGVLMQLADTAEAEGDPGKAVGYLRRYLALAPSDTDTRTRFGLLLTRLARSPRERLQAFMVLEEVLRRDPGRNDVRRQAAELALSIGPDLLPDAKRHLDWLIESHPEDGELESLYADAHLIDRDYASAERRLAAAVRKKPDLYEAYVRRALLLRDRLTRPEEADEVVTKELLGPAANRMAYRAHLAAAAYWEATGRPNNRAEAIREAGLLAPDDLEVILAMAELEDQEKARMTLRRGIDLHAGSVGELTAEAAAGLDTTAKVRRLLVGELFRRLANLEIRAGDLAAAEETTRRGIKLIPETNLALTLADIHIRQARYDEAEKELEGLERSGLSDLTIDYHRSRILAGKGKWVDATRKLEAVLGQQNLPRDIVVSGSLLLGLCYEQLGEIDRRYAAYRRAVSGLSENDPQWELANDRLAAALVETGQQEEAIKVYEQIAARQRQESRPVTANLQLGRLLLRQTLREPPNRRNWSEVEKVIRAAPDTVDGAVLLAEMYVAQGNRLRAREELEAAIAKFPKEVAPRIALALSEHYDGKPDRAREILKLTRAELGSMVEVDVRLAEARMSTSPLGPQSAAALSQLAEGIDALAPADRRRLLRGLSDLAAGVGDPALATRFQERIFEFNANDLSALLVLLDDAIRSQDEKKAQQYLEKVKQIDAGGTTYQAAKAAFLIGKAQAGDRSQLDEADKLFAVVRRDRPWWPRAALGQALVADLRGDSATAAVRYREAVDAGERRADVFQRLLQIYSDLGQYKEAEQLLTKLPEGSGLLAGSELLVSELSLRAGNHQRALQLAERLTPPDETDPQKLLWLAQLRRLAEQPADRVEAPIRQAVKVAGDQPGPWVALVQFLASSGRKEDAEKEAQEADRRLGAKHSLAVAQCYEAVGDAVRARTLYEAALKGNPKDPATLRTAAAFFLRANEPDRVAQIAQQMRDIKDLPVTDRELAYRLLGITASGRGYQDSLKVLAEIGMLENGRPTKLTGRETPEQLRTRAVVLAVQRDAALRREAIEALERIEAGQPLPPEEQFLLARLLVSVGEWPRARVRLAGLVRSKQENVNTAFYAGYYGFAALQFEDNTREARLCLELLSKAQPDSPRTVELKARILEAEGKRDEAAAAIEGYLARSDANLDFASALYERLDMADRAEPLYRRQALDPKNPNAILALASFLGRQGRTRDALVALRDASEKVPQAAVAAVGAEVLYHAHQVESEYVRQVDAWLNAASEGADNRLTGQLLGLSAVVRMAEGRYKEAIELYQKALKQYADDPLALNNLGYLLSAHEKRHDTALQLVERAKQLAGPLPTIIDTEAMILVRKGEAERAVELLTDTTKESSDPAAFFHLALAQEKMGNQAGKLFALRQAKRLKIRPIDVPPPERADLARALESVR